jgi:hypothetical protein
MKMASSARLNGMSLQVPKWFDDPDMPRPCPCGRPPHGPMVLAEMEDGGRIMIHASCAARMGMIEDDDD